MDRWKSLAKQTGQTVATKLADPATNPLLDPEFRAKAKQAGGDAASRAAQSVAQKVPDSATIQKHISGLNEQQIAALLRPALSGLTPQARQKIGVMVNGFAQASGVRAPGSVGADPAALASTVATLMKNGNGLGTLAAIFGATTSSGAVDLKALLSNPLARQLIFSLLPGPFRGMRF